jgi:hypothetical protein
LAATAVLGGLEASNILHVSILGLALSGGVDLLLLIVLTTIVRPEWVREAGDAYADRLLASLEVL